MSVEPPNVREAHHGFTSPLQQGAKLLCEANRTCKAQLAGITCCLKDGTAFSVHLIIKPTAVRCRLLDHAVDLEGLVLSRN